MSTALEHWADLDGYAVAHNLDDLQELRIDRFSNYVWYMLTRNAEPNDIEKLKAQLWMPEAGEVVTDERSPWSAKNEGEAFAAFKRGIGG